MSTSSDAAAHDISIAVWDLTSPVIAGRRAVAKVGIACACGCDLTGARIDLCNETGAPVGGGEAGPAPWPGTAALYWTELDFVPPDAEGEHSWSLHAIAPGPSHGPAMSVVPFVATRPPEHHVTLQVIDRRSGVAVAGVELRLGAFRTATDGAGVAHVDMPGGAYNVSAWKIGYDPLSTTALVSGDATVRLEMTVTAEREQPYWM